MAFGMAKTGVRRRNRDVVRSFMMVSGLCNDRVRQRRRTCGIYIVLEEWRTELQLFYLLNKGKG